MPAAALVMIGTTYSQVLGMFLLCTRERRFDTQGAACKRLNLSQSALSRIESGSTKITVVQLRQIGEAYKFSPSVFIAELEAICDNIRERGIPVLGKSGRGTVLVGKRDLRGLVMTHGHKSFVGAQ